MKYHKINSIYKRDTNNKFTPEYSCEEFYYLRNNKWIGEEKIDGTNIRIIINKDGVAVKGRTDKAQPVEPLYTNIKEHFSKIDLSTIFNLEEETILYGEGCGHRIQKNGELYTNMEKIQQFILFDVYHRNRFLIRDAVKDIACKLNLKHSISVFFGTLEEAEEYVKAKPLSKYLEDYCSFLNDKFIMEGLVLRPMVGLNDRHGNRIITKIKVKDFE